MLDNPNRVFIHMEYSKNDISKKAVRSIVEATLQETIDELSRHLPNYRGILTPDPKTQKTSSSKLNYIKQKEKS